MPMDRVDQLPLPSLHWYAGFSGLALFYVLVYGMATPEGLWTTLWSDLWCSAAVLNMGCCCLFLLASFVQSIVFGKLQLVEQQHMRDKFWNFVFYKFIFVFGVLNVQEMPEMMGWCVWFAVLGTLLLTEQMCKDRFQLLSFSPNTVPSTHAKVIVLLVTVFLSCGGLFMVCAIVGWQYGFTHFTFLFSEVFILFARSLHTIIRYIIHLWDLHHDGTWENRTMYTYYTEMVLELAALSVEFLHHVHMLMWANMLLSVASLILLMKLRFLYQEIQRRLRRHKNYLSVSRTLENRFTPVPQEELARSDDVCAICWEKMSSARRLPCGHIFHTGCLRSWLEQDTVCPTCRRSLNEELQASGRHEGEEEGEGVRGRWRRRFRRHRNWLLHFNGASIASWLPTFSVELHDDGLIGNDLADLHRGAQQVHSMFPHVPLQAITLDLADTRSISLTVDHILNNVIYIPGTTVERLPSVSPHTPSPPSPPSPFSPPPPASTPVSPPQGAQPSSVTLLESAGNGLRGQGSERWVEPDSEQQAVRQRWVEPAGEQQTVRQRRRDSSEVRETDVAGAPRISRTVRQVAIRGTNHQGASPPDGHSSHSIVRQPSDTGSSVSEDDSMSFSSLQRRKRELLSDAKRRYLLKHHTTVMQ